MESLHGLTKGTELEPLIKAAAQAEANGTMMYYGLARLAREQGLEEVAEKFIEAANQEAVHAGFYATLNGKYPQNFWGMVATLAKAETAGELRVNELAKQVRALGFDKAADEMEVFAKQEGHHGVLMEEILAKYKPADVEIASVDPNAKVYVCSCCGYEYVGDLDKEPDDWVCPICGQPKSAFKLKNAEEKKEVAPDAKTYVCSVCGYEYVGDLDKEPDDWVCPICGRPKSAFKLKG